MTRKLLVVFSSAVVLAIVLLSAAWLVGGKGFVDDLQKKDGWTINIDDDDDGPKSTKTLVYDGSQVLTLDAPVELKFTRGADAKMIVEGPTKAMEALRWEGGRLWLEGYNRLHGGLKVTVVAPQLPGLVLNGAGDVELNDLQQPALAIDLRGAGSIEGTGTVKTLSVLTKGAGSVDFSELAVEDAKVSTRGVGDVEIAATGKVDVEIAGTGSVSLHRKPRELTSRISGIGSVDEDY